MKNKTLLSVITAILFLTPVVINAQTIDPGTISKFVIFSSNGAVGNTGKSNLTGDVGTNSGAITGFGNVNGVMQNNNIATNGAVTDLLSLYTQLDTLPANFFRAPLLGNGDTLKAGVYSIAGDATLNLNLILDAEGNANAKFIFKIAGTFASGSAAKILLINNAASCNVYWKIEGAVSLASATEMKGTIVANNAAIAISTGVLLEGRAVTTTGAITLNGVTAKLASGCGSAMLTGPAAPNLDAILCYGIFSANGSVTNAGITNVTGDIGTNVGLTTGYNPLFVTGMIHPIPDGSTSAAATSLVNVYTYLNSLPHDIELLYPADFGKDLVLTPHSYLLSGAATLTDTLTLNAEGNVNAVFYINVTGAFSTTTFAKVKLINGAKAQNVFWKVEGAVNINDYAEFKGTVICNNGAMSIATGAKVEGRMLTTNGALSTSAINLVIETSACTTTPVTWLYFRGKAVQKKVLLEWATSDELNNSFFTIEKSNDGIRYESLGRVNAGTTLSHQENNYSFTDQNPFSINYYRIYQTDNDGNRKYYRTIIIRLSTGMEMIVSHHVRGSEISVQTSGLSGKQALIELFSIDGKKLISEQIILSQDISSHSINKPSNKGVFFLRVSAAGEKAYATKLLIQ